MNLIKPSAALLLTLVLVTACTNTEKYPYAIKDFRPELQPYLASIVTTGYVGFDTATRFVRSHATDDELVKLSRSEIPVLRATALRAIAKRNTMDNFDILMHHLDDTALIVYDRGEWGLQFNMVSDDMIDNSTWRTEEEKNKTVDSVIMKHNYLKSAYIILSRIDTVTKYYPFIKQMLFAEKPFENIEEALYSMAKYKRKGDALFVKQFLSDKSRCYQMKGGSFSLMKDFPDTSYLSLLEEYYKNHFYRHISLDRDIYTAEAYIKAVSSYKCPRSAEILTKMFNRRPFVGAAVDTAYLKDIAVDCVRNDSCAAYSKLIQQIRPLIIRYDKTRGSFTVDYDSIPFVTKKTIRW